MKPRARTLLLAGALVLTAAVAALGGLAFARRVASFQPLGFRAAQAGPGQWLVVAVDSPTSALRAGDQILLVDGQQTPDRASLRRLVGRSARAEMVVLRGENLATIAYERPPVDLDVPYLILSLIAVLYLLIGLYTLLRDPRRRVFLFFAWCLASAVFYLFKPGSELGDPAGKAIYLFDELARVLLPPLTLHLFLVFPAPWSERRWGRRLIPFLYLPAAALLALQVDLALFNGRWIFGQPTRASIVALDRLELAHLVLFALAAIFVLLRRLAAHRDWEQQRQVQWVAIGMAGGYLPFTLLYVVPLLGGLRAPELLAAIAVCSLAFVPVGFAYAILRYKLWDIGLIVRDTAAYTLTLLLGIFGFSLVNLTISRGLPPGLPLARNLASFAAGLVIAALLVPTKRTIAASLERLQYRGAFGKRRALLEFGRELLHERDLDRLCGRLLAQLEDGLELERANLFVAQGATMIPVRPEPGLPGQLLPDALGPDLWRREFETLSGVAFPAATLMPAQRLFVLGYRYAFPLQVRGSRVGVVVTGFRQEGRPLSTEDVELVRGLLNQASLAIENAQLVDQLHRQLEEVVRLQQHNEGIIESTPAGIAVLDREGRVVSANLAFAALAGTRRAAAIGRPLAELLPVQPLPQPGDGLLDVSFCDAHGQERHLQLSSATLDRGSPDLRVLVVQDVSERVAMENALKEKDRLAALGMLAAGVAHEVNTPITGISSYAQMLLAETAESDPRYELLKKVERQTFRAARIVNSLLEFARDRQGEARPVGLSALVGECLDLLRERLQERKIALHWRKPERDVVVHGNDGELQQVVTNLLLNAVDAMRGGGNLRVELSAEDGVARLAVDDDGPGVPPALVEKIFQPFFSTKLEKGGTGLGLSISYAIVRRHGGEMRVRNKPDRGCRFEVELPLGGPGTPPPGA